MTLYPKKSIVPPGGYHFVEKHDSVSIRLESESVEMLADVLLRYRLANGLPPGDPLKEISDYICGSWPHFCADSEPASVPPRPLSKAHSLSRRASDWLSRLFRLGSQKSATPDQAARRAEICASCPQNAEYRGTGCASCVSTMERLAFVWKRNRALINDHKLGVCRVTGQLNSCAVWTTVRPERGEDDPLPGNCWLRKDP